MPSLTIHHIGYLVKKIEKARQAFLDLGYLLEQDIIYDSIRKVNICFLVKDGYRVELVSPVSEDSVVASLMKRFKNSPYHICYEASDFTSDYETLIANGFMAIDEPTLAPALHEREVVFLTSPVMGMIELIKNNN